MSGVHQLQQTPGFVYPPRARRKANLPHHHEIAPRTPSPSPDPASPDSSTLPGTPSNTGRPGLGGLPRTIPLTPTRSGAYPRGGDTSGVAARSGAAFAGSPQRWGGSANPSCPRCGKSVYFAEQVRSDTQSMMSI
ncbi:hypothetical protein C0993_006388 [Termitomyces sp. T159_Od127]|nr:hypothetical protein C0993_006388 [Termitomyces sp. T159_Od127]